METIGKYEVKGSSEWEGFVLHQGVDPADGKSVSIRRAESPTQAESLRREEQNLAGLDHPGLPKLIAHEEDEAAGPYLIEESVPTLSLKDRLNSSDAVTPEAAWAWIEQTASALDYLHRRGVIHGNVAPGNIWIGSNGAVQLRGFDLATRQDASTEPPAVEEYSRAIGYHAPEFLLGDSFNGSADQFSLAVVAVECLTGKSPFQGDSNLTVLLDTVFSPAKLDVLEDRYPAAVLRVCERALSKSSARRFATCADFASAIGSALSGKTSSETRAISATQMAAELANVESVRGARSSRSGNAAPVPPAPNYGLWAAGVAVLLAIAGAFYWFTRPEQPSITPAAAPSDAFRDAAKSIVNSTPAVSTTPKVVRPSQPKKAKAPEVTVAPPVPEKAVEKGPDNAKEQLRFTPLPTRRN
jgi:serine/threonine-protein kinase